MSVVEQLAKLSRLERGRLYPAVTRLPVADATNGTHDDDDDDDDHGRRLVLGRRPKVGHGHSLLPVRAWTVAGIIIPLSTIVGVDQPAIQRRFETYSTAKIAQCADIHKASGGD
jgi:hypothetical protein